MDSSSVRKNHFGFYELVEKPSPSELKQYYAEKYYQDSSSSYERQYATDEVEYFKNKLQQKYLAALKKPNGETPSTLLKIWLSEISMKILKSFYSRTGALI